MSPAARRAFLDRPAARVCAAVVFLLCVAALAYLQRDAWRPRAAPEAAAADDPVACERDRLAVIDGQLHDGVLKPEQAQLFRARVDALCQAQNRKGVPAGLPPGMAPTQLPSR